MIEIKGLETYFGGKGASGTYQKIINCIPECDVMISGFLGADFVIRNMNNIPWKVIGIDRDPEVIEMWYNSVSLPQYEFYTGKFLHIYKEWLEPVMKAFNKPFFYLDPPYPISTRSSNHRYKFDMTTEDHIEFLQFISKFPHNCAISTYDSELYEENLTGWRKIHFESKTQSGMRTETLYMNYDISQLPLQDHSYTGDNYRERDRIRRKSKRWKNRIEKMSKEERDFLFLELQKFYCSMANNVKSDDTGLSWPRQN